MSRSVLLHVAMTTAPPSATREVRYARLAALSLGLAHAAIGVAFAVVGVWPLVVVNLGSVLAFVFAHRLIAHDRIGWSKVVCAIEIVVHAVLASRWVGWDTGFHFYLLLLGPAIFADYRLRLGSKFALLAALMVAYVAMDAGLRPLAPWAVLAPRVVDLFRWVNDASVLYWLAHEMHWYVRTARRSERTLNRLATLDPLTGLGNRRRLDDLAPQVLLEAADSGVPFSVIAADLDHFKRVNDQHGHAVGDEVLKAVARAFGAETRQHDVAARLGGEEFLLLLPQTRLEIAANIAARLAAGIRQLRIEPLERGVTCTFGVATWRPGESFDDCVLRADRALYEGKRDGRDRVVRSA